jgi:tRNA(fMet)-specific endonuclease VapC
LSRICLDTCAYSGFRRGHPEIMDLVSTASWVGVPAVVLGELRAGFLRGTRAARNERELTEFLADPLVELVPVDDEVSRHYAEIVVALRNAGTPVPTNDAWIAASAAAAGAAVLTCDAHFGRIARVRSVIVE